MNHQHKIMRRGNVPAYMQIVNILKEQIAEGKYLPGDRLPPESELCKRYQVSPMTVRRSINMLIDQKVVSTIQGSGTYVKGPDLDGVTFSLEEFSNIFKDTERTKVKIIDVQIIKAGSGAAKNLDLKIGDKTIVINRVLSRNGDPIIYHKDVTPLYGLFFKGRGSLKMGKLSIEAAVLSGEEADVLGTTQMSPAFRIEHVFYDLDDKPTSWGRFICRGDSIRFTTTIGINALR